MGFYLLLARLLTIPISPVIADCIVIGVSPTSHTIPWCHFPVALQRKDLLQESWCDCRVRDGGGGLEEEAKVQAFLRN